jgi:hypothetical protein
LSKEEAKVEVDAAHRYVARFRQRRPPPTSGRATLRRRPNIGNDRKQRPALGISLRWSNSSDPNVS